VGGGYVGLYSALVLQKRLRRGEAQITLVTPESFLLYQPFLPEAAAGNIEPRHVVVPLRPLLRRSRLITGRVTAMDESQRTAVVEPKEGPAYQVAFDVAIVAPGSVSRVPPIPGLAERAVGFKSVSEAIYLRNQVLSRMDAAESTTDEAVRRRALTFVFIGGGYAGVEALAELEDMARSACRHYRTVRREDMRWVLVDMAPAILPEIGRDLGEYALGRLRHRGIEVFLETRLESAEDGVVRLSNGREFETETLVWTAGVRAHPALVGFGLPLDDRGRVRVDEYLRVVGVEGVWSAGDCAAVPDLATGGLSPPTAQHALRQARRLGKNVVAVLRGEQPKPFRYRALGGLASLGLYKGVARVLGVRLRGFPAWFVHRTYHVSRIPTLNRKVRVILDWTVGLFFRRDIVQLGSLQEPRGPITEATSPSPKGGAPWQS
jgi:NADH:quinone reductase (non-electrogenic)